MFESCRAHQINQSFTLRGSPGIEYHEYESGWADVLASAQKIHQGDEEFRTGRVERIQVRDFRKALQSTMRDRAVLF